MEIVGFDRSLSVPVSNHGSRFALAPLLETDAAVAVNVAHLGRGGVVGRHRAASRQLLAVVSGSGWASGEDGARRELSAGRAALFEANEEHDAGSDEGLVAVVIEGRFVLRATSITRDIVVEDYDRAWEVWFATLEAFVWPAVADLALRLDHVGSTSVPGLAARPVIDADIVVRSPEDVHGVIDRLGTLGYRWRGDLGVLGREAFDPPKEPSLPAHHLYLVVEDSKAHLDHWLLRDLLRADPEARDAYGELKRRNAELADRDMERYVALKAPFVSGLLARARAEHGLAPKRPADGT